MKLRNVSPYGDLDIPLIRNVVQGGTTFEVSEDQARVLLAQTDNYEPADDEAKAIAKKIGVIHEPKKKAAPRKRAAKKAPAKKAAAPPAPPVESGEDDSKGDDQ